MKRNYNSSFSKRFSWTFIFSISKSKYFATL
nr:MAG TPA: hypothetical protein [Caudoviricetes sp.]